MQKRWTLKPAPDPKAVEALTHARSTPALATLLAQRSISSPEQAKAFYHPEMQQLHDPFLMQDMDRAVERIELALREKQPIMIYGDYDVDGTTSVALVYSVLSRCTGAISHYIPDRYAEGYGISTQGIDRAAELGVKLIIALDCGIKSSDKVEYATGLGIDFIICDHHLPSEKIPAAVAVLDPKRPDCAYPFKELSGCGIGFKLMQGFAQHNDMPFAEIAELLDLVAVSIGCDIVPVDGENRVLAHFGLKRLNEEEPRPGIKALLGMSNFSRKLTITDLVFVLGPRINAAGRIEHGQQAVELLLAKSANEAENIGKRIDGNNSARQDLDKAITEEALDLFATDPFLQDSWSTVVFNPNWHKGVVGIVASRLIERHYRPTIVLTESNGKVSGSARSVKGFNVHDAIGACSDLLEQFGGHMYAAGLTMKPENVPAFRDRFEAVVRERMLPSQRIPEEDVDLEIALADIKTLERGVEGMEPFGPANMKPVFLLRGMAAKDVRLLGNSGDHLKFQLCDPRDPKLLLDAIAFRQGEHFDLLRSGEPFSVLCTVEKNTWRGNTTIQLNIKDIKAGVVDVLETAGHNLEKASA
ncbi:MAG: single-stranded-DNA-specific exonuclease RecJ [Flavobacteriales bacterium]|jgi:single-stranded-DNA-specific exonuclease|nr:single-stranded-DNA-specific exonuclease RecJ [Flavobacteriales bacterium]MCI1751523.1 single-stranded-DNA-specific exonuclease RecJ [Flavobacteriales bacterium]